VGDQLSQDLASLRIDRNVPKPPSAMRGVVITVVALALVSGAGYLGYKRMEPSLFKQEVKTTQILLISPSQAEVNVTSTGYVIPQQTSKVGAKVPGRLAKVLVKEGDTVKAGDVIAVLEDGDQRSSIAQAQSRVAAAHARTETARANLADLTQQIQREKQLVEKGASGRATLENLEARERALAEAVKAAQAETSATQAEVSVFSVGLKDRTIIAPIAGTVVSKPAAVGELVGLTSGAVGQGSVAEIADFSSMLVETDVPEARLGQVKVGSPAEIVLDAYPSKRHRGTAVEIGKKVNRSKATVVVKVKFEGSLEGVLPEMSARVSFLQKAITDEALKEAPKKMVVADAVVDAKGAPYLWTVEDGKLHKVPVTLGPQSGSSLELTNGPPPGTKIIAKPNPQMAEGQRIKETDS
jgi:HlyD family secretion protein